MGGYPNNASRIVSGMEASMRFRDTSAANRVALDAVQAAESDGCVFSVELQGFPVWWFVRFRVHEVLARKLLQEADGPGHSWSSAMNLDSMLTTIGRMTTGHHRMSTSRTSNPIMFFCGSNGFGSTPSTSDVSGSHRLFGEIYGRLPDDKRVFIEKPTDRMSDRHTLKQNSEAVFWDWALALCALRQGLAMPPKVEGVAQFKRALAGVRSFPVDKRLFESVVLDELGLRSRKITIQLEAARTILDRFQPALVFETASYDSASVAVNCIAQSSGVPVVEMQHGVLYPDHPGYSACAPPRVDIVRPIPDKIFVYGEWFRDSLELSSQFYTGDVVEVVGSPRLSNYKNAVLLRGRARIREMTRSRLGVGPESILVTATTQPIVSTGIAQFLEQVVRLMPTSCYLCVKIHPGEMSHVRATYGRLSEHPRVRIITDEHSDLYDLLVASDIHTSVCSTVVLEAMALGTPNILIDMDSPLSMADLVDPSTRQVVASPESFVDSVIALARDTELRDRVVSAGLIDARRFFRDDVDVAEVVSKRLLQLSGLL